MKTAKEKLQQRLSAALKAALIHEHASARQLSLLGFAAVSDMKGAEQVSLPFAGRQAFLLQHLSCFCMPSCFIIASYVALAYCLFKEPHNCQGQSLKTCLLCLTPDYHRYR